MFRSSGTTPKTRRKPGEKQYDSPLEELTGCVDRIEELVTTTKDDWEIHGGPLSQSGRSFFRRARSQNRMDGSRRLDESTHDGSLSSLKEPDAQFIPMAPVEEEEMVELLRRVAELVVMGEKAAAAVMSKQEKRAKQRTENPDGRSSKMDAEIADLEPHIALFENFFERNTLSLMVEIVTGVAFSASDDDNVGIEPSDASLDISGARDMLSPKTKDSKLDDSTVESVLSDGPFSSTRRKSSSRMLPAFSIATQAVQSVSILIQNVSRATSLYFLLSNNHINDLINLPLDLYSIAEQYKAGLDVNLNPRRTSAEIQELTTHVITFLKSLALRMNAETLQFFLTYPSEGSSENEAGPASSSHFASSENIDEASSLKGDSAKDIQAAEVEFPLYARALDFCVSSQDSFVRTTAMNICLNTLRLITVNPSEDDAANERYGKSPDGTLASAQALPIRERLAIAQHVCNPARVESLVSPIFTKVAHLWGVLEEQIRELDLLNVGKMDEAGRQRVRSAKMARARDSAKRKKISDTLSDAVADFQDEFLLLEDVFQVGLTSMNEQVIEMMLATFIYPLLMQPLLLYMQRFLSSSGQASAIAAIDILCKRGENVERAESITSDRIQEAAGAKTAMFALCGVFHFMSNPTLLRLLLTALLYPISPDSSSETTIRAKPDVAGQDKQKNITVRIDFQNETKPIKMGKSPYAFGTVTGEKSLKSVSTDIGKKGKEKGDLSCVFVLAPALMEVLEGDPNSTDLKLKTRPNPYRQAILQCLSSAPSGLHLRQMAVLMLDAMVSQFDGKFAAKIVFGEDMRARNHSVIDNDNDIPLDEMHLDSWTARNADNRDMGGSGSSSRRFYSRSNSSSSSRGDYMNEVVSALCLSTINVGNQYKGLYKVSFDPVGAHTLLYLLRENKDALEYGSRIADHRRRQTSFYLAELPAKIDHVIASEQESDHEDLLSDDSTQRKGFYLFQMFYDVVRESKFTVLGELLRLKETVGKSEEDEYSQSVAMSGKFQDLSDLVCGVGRFSSKDDLSDIRAGAVRVGGVSAAEFLRIDAFSGFLKELKTTRCKVVEGQVLSGFAVSRSGVILNTRLSSGMDVSRSIFSPLSESLVSKLLRPEDDGKEKGPPQQGSIVGLVGRTAIPCVCEVPQSSSHLLSSQAQSVVSEGVTWQSLYLVFLSRHMILAEPEREGAGGNGRVVTSCNVANLMVERDNTVQVPGSSPARRLLLTHVSVQASVPGLFIGEDTPTPFSFGPFNRLKERKSHLDVWFEDQGAADHALRVVEMKLKKGRAKRGNRLRERLAEDG